MTNGHSHSERGTEQWEHYAHYAHQAHLAAEGTEFAAHKLSHAAEYLKHVQAAARLSKTHGQMAYDLRRMARGIAKLENVAKEGGARGAKASQQLSRARAAFQAAQSEFEVERPAVNAARKVLGEYRAVQRGAQGEALLKLGEAASRLETALSTSRVGSKLLTVGRITVSKNFVRGLIVVGAACEAVSSYTDSTARTFGGKAANAVLGAGSGALTMLNPYVAAGDLVAPDGYKLSQIYHGGAAAVSALGEGILTNDSRAMDDFHRRSMQGSYGKVIQAASEAGEYWANKGISGGLREFVEAVHWWMSQ